MFSATSKKEGKDRIGLLEGKVRIYRKADWKVAEHDPQTGERLGTANCPQAVMETIFDHVDGEELPPVDRAATLRQHLLDTDAVLDRLAVFVIKCEIARTGFVTLSESNRRRDVEFASSVTDRPAPLDDKAARYLCNQAYFFLKDIAHVHRHHHPRSDTITAAYASDREESWIRETQYSIHRRVVTLRRNASAMNLYDSLGIMAYMASFAKIVEESKASSKEGAKIALQYNLPELESSIKASLESRRWVRVQTNLVLTAIPALLIALASLLKPALVPGATPAPNIEANPTLFDGVRQAAAALFPPDLYGFLSIIFCLSLVPVIYGWIDPRRSIPVMNIKRIMTVWSRQRQVTIWLLLASSAFVGSGYLIYGAILGTATREIAWKIVVSMVVGTGLGIVFFPYIFTVPDLWQRLRGRDPLARRT